MSCVDWLPLCSLALQHGPYSIFSVDSETGNVNAEGQLTVRDTALFGKAVTVDARLDVTGGATVTGGGLAVAEAVSLLSSSENALYIGGNLDVGGKMDLTDGLAVDGDVSLGSTDVTELVMGGDFRVLNATGGVKFLATPLTGDIAVDGALSVDGVTTISSSVDLGDSAADAVTVHLRAVHRRVRVQLIGHL